MSGNANVTANGKARSNAKDIVIIALTAAIICVLAPLSIPLPNYVPISLTNLALYFLVYIVGTRRTSIAFVVYCLLGLVGLPVFSGFQGGAQKLVGPTGGFIVGFLPMIIVMGLFIEKHYEKKVLCVIVMEASTWIAYLLGTFWYCYSMKAPFAAAIAACVLPFLAEDLIKMIVAAIFGPSIRKRLRAANVID